jgi:tRNA(Ile2) C34 agmatinyltransferase TiaS
MANGMFDFTGWRILTPEEVAEQKLIDDEYFAEELKRWPLSQRRPRCLNCGAFTRMGHGWYDRCKNCGESYDSLQ